MDLIKIPIYVISVRSFTDRHEHIRRLSERHKFSYEYVFDYDACVLTDSDWARIGGDMSAACASTVLKHLECQRRMLSSGHRMALVLEDDVVFFDEFCSRLSELVLIARNLAPGWLIFLGGADSKLDKRFLRSSKMELIEKPISTAEAYLIDLVGCERRLEWFEINKITRPADHQLKYTDNEIGITQYWVNKSLCTQGSVSGVFKTSLDGSRAKRSLLFLKWRYSVRRFFRQQLKRWVFSLRSRHVLWSSCKSKRS